MKKSMSGETNKMVTKILSDHVTGIRYEDLDRRTIEYTKMCVQDLVGVALSGSASEVGQIWWKYSMGDPVQSKATATCWNSSLCKADYRTAAAYNAACGHLLDMDDLHNSSIAHLGAVTIPAAMAIGQAKRCSGRDILTAVVAGYEAGARIGETINPEAYKCWHTTGVVGSYSSAVAAGKLLRLNEGQMLNAIGTAGTQSAGLWEFMENGSMSKSIHTANAVLCGIRAAELAALGFTGAHTILEGEKGFVKALASKEADTAIRRLGEEPYKILTNSFKPYACCRHTHSSCACIKWMKDTYQIDPAKIRKIVDRTYAVALDVADKPAPTTPYSFKFSIQYCIAAMLLYDDLSEDVFSSEKTRDQQVLELMRKIEVLEDQKIQSAFEENPNQWTHALEILMEDGRVLRHHVDFPPGDFMNPFSWADADEKFYRITRAVIPEKAAGKIIERIHRLEELEDIQLLFDVFA